MNWTVYILECSDGSLYTGITTDLDRRLEEHHIGRGAKYTQGRGPFKLVYREKRKDRANASKREMKIKALSRPQKLSMISGKRPLI